MGYAKCNSKLPECDLKDCSACNSTSVEALTWLDESLMMIFCQ